MNATTQRLSWRRFVTLQVLLGFSLLTVTGLVMFLWPPREIAMATRYTLLGAGKGTWEDVHLTFSFLFLAAVGVHLWLNRRPLLAYLGKLPQAFRLNAETVLTLLFGAGLTAATLLLT